MGIPVTLTDVQPSSTTLRYRFGSIEIHSPVPSVTMSLRIIDYLEKGVANWEAYEGSIGSIEPGTGPLDIVYEEKPSTYLIIVDPGVGCPLMCPWCYEGPVPFNNKRMVDLEKLAGNVLQVLRRLRDESNKEEKTYHVSIVFGGSTDPSFSPSTVSGFYEILTNMIVRRLGGEWYGSEVYVPDNLVVVYAISTSSPAPAYNTRSFKEVAVTYFTPEMINIHPRFRGLSETYYDLLEYYPKKIKGTIADKLTLSIMLYSGMTPADIIIPSGYDKVFLLHYHPSNPRLPFKPPTRETILNIMRYLVGELGITIEKINVDACTLIKLGANENWVHYAETHNIIRCTHGGCRYAKICPRGGNKCIVSRTND